MIGNDPYPTDPAMKSRSSATAISCPGTVPGQCGVLIAGIARH
jgi:hypothetical protein